MIGEIIENLNIRLSGMPFFKTVYGVCELKKNGQDVESPVYWSNQKWNNIKPNGFGFSYWRKRSDVTIIEAVSYSSCGTEYTQTIPLRLFALTTRSEFPSDDSYSGDRLASTLQKALTVTGGDLKREIGARQLSIRSVLYSTDTEKIISEELDGTNRKDYRHCDLVVALDINIVITKSTDCIIEACDYTPQFCLLLENYVAIPS